MPELRCDPISGRWIVIATKRARRPEDFIREPSEKKEANTHCPFCYGNEKLTPPEVLAYRKNNLPNTPGWKVRVVPNKFSAFESKGKVFSPSKNRLYQQGEAVGFHEVVTFSPSHEKDIDSLPLGQVKLIIAALQERYIALKEKKNVKYILPIINKGKEAGASLDHPHAQLFTMPLVPEAVEKEVASSENYFKTTNKCIFCQLIKEEIKLGKRVIFETKKFIAISPYASRVPFETWLLPKNHRPRFEEIAPDEKEELAKNLKKILALLAKRLGSAPYNLFLHTTPPNYKDGRQSKKKDYYHWHIEVLPKLVTPAAFEAGSGIMINIAKPEDTTKFLRGKT